MTLGNMFGMIRLPLVHCPWMSYFVHAKPSQVIGVQNDQDIRVMVRAFTFRGFPIVDGEFFVMS